MSQRIMSPGRTGPTQAQVDANYSGTTLAGKVTIKGKEVALDLVDAEGSLWDAITTVRDLAGIDRVGLPVWGTGLTPGHGVLSLVRYNDPVTVNQLLVYPGEIVAADGDGVVKIPEGSLTIGRAAKQIAAMIRAGHPLDSARELVDAADRKSALDWAGIQDEDW